MSVQVTPKLPVRVEGGTLAIGPLPPADISGISVPGQLPQRFVVYGVVGDEGLGTVYETRDGGRIMEDSCPMSFPDCLPAGCSSFSCVIECILFWWLPRPCCLACYANLFS